MTDLATAFTFLATPGGLMRRPAAAMVAAQNPDRSCRGDPECGRNLFMDEQQRAWRCGNCRGVYHRAPRNSTPAPAVAAVAADPSPPPSPPDNCTCCRRCKRGLDEAVFQMLVLSGLLLILIVQIVVRK
ncbi:hypothetical protein [Medusavirus stheno T3]|uniref:Uncharacterized protein n=1 Tax=Medusavirus stheno T3 TaxID=3069717 RepID=A0A7S8BDD9_9VIRU|nr:hypothetical protein QKU73_gp414 [Acanthamoeba castellanii medusavirus]QPB44361.1 hypothetical protein [Medusavirus stheno T3]